MGKGRSPSRSKSIGRREAAGRSATLSQSVTQSRSLTGCLQLSELVGYKVDVPNAAWKGYTDGGFFTGLHDGRG